jgi:hypothetical protein
MHHAVEVVGPIRQAAPAPIAQGDAGFRGQARADAIDLGIRQIEHHHGIGAIAEFVVAHDDAEALDHALVEPCWRRAPAPRPRSCTGFRRTARKGRGTSSRPGCSAAINRMSLGIRLAHRRVGNPGVMLVRGLQVEAEVDVVLLLQRQREHRQPVSPSIAPAPASARPGRRRWRRTRGCNDARAGSCGSPPAAR